jgi:hypothetical protein
MVKDPDWAKVRHQLLLQHMAYDTAMPAYPYPFLPTRAAMSLAIDS